MMLPLHPVELRGFGLAAGAALFAVLALAAAVGADDWPQHLGPRRNGTSLEPAPPTWPAEGPEILWRKAVGEGFSAPVATRDRLLLFHRVEGEERLDCLDPATGTEVWSYTYPTSYRDDFGFDEGPRGAPTIDGTTVYTHGAQGVLTAIDLESGLARWSLPTHKAFGVRKGFFGTAASPLVDNGRVFLNIGGRDAGIVAFSTDDGRLLWQATRHEASYASAIMADIQGHRSVLVFTREGLSILEPSSGRVQSELRWRARSRSSVNAATPLVIEGRIFLTASYQTGAVLLQPKGGRLEEVWSSDEVLSSHYSTSVHHEGHLYGFHGRQEYGASLRSVELGTGRVNWSLDRFGSGTVTRISDRLLILHEDGRLILAESTPERFVLLAEATILHSVVRSYPAYSNGVLYARSKTELIAVRLRSNDPRKSPEAAE